MSTIYYHHPDNQQYSLDFLHDNPQQIETRIDSYDDHIKAKCIEYDFDQKFTIVYTTSAGGEAVKNLDFDIINEIATVGEDNRRIVARLFEIYQAVVTTNEAETGTPIEAYKNIDVRSLPTVLDRTDWTGTATEVAGRLASNLILQHALPNANHRTAVALIQYYLRQINSDFSMSKTAVETEPDTHGWQEWVNSYINESKRLLTVRRKNVPLKHASEFGALFCRRLLIRTSVEASQ